MIELLSKKAGPMPVYAWFIIGVGGLVMYMLLHKSSASQAAAAQQAAQNSTQPLSSNVLNPENAAALTQGAGAMPYMGGDIYNNVAVASNPTTTSASNATSSATSAATGNQLTVQAPPPPPAPAPPPAPVQAPAPSTHWVWYTVQPGDNLSKIAAKYGTTWQNIWSYNTTPGNRSAASEATLESRGPNLIYAGGSFLVPEKS